MNEANEVQIPSDIPEGMMIVVSNPMMQAMLTGVEYCRVERTGHVTLYYIGGTKERGNDPLPVDCTIPKLCGLIEHVQDQRREKNTTWGNYEEVRT